MASKDMKVKCLICDKELAPSSLRGHNVRMHKVEVLTPAPAEQKTDDELEMMNDDEDEADMVDMVEDMEDAQVADKIEEEALKKRTTAVEPGKEWMRRTMHGHELGLMLEKVPKESTGAAEKVSTGLAKKPCSDCFLGKEENRKMAKELKENKEEVKARDDWFLVLEEREQEIEVLKETIRKLEEENKDLKSKEIIVIEEEDEVEDKCSFCKFVGKSKKVVNGHMKFEHLQCTDCGDRFSSMQEMDSHLEEKHEVAYYTCSSCGSSVDTLAALDEHIREGHSKFPGFKTHKTSKEGNRSETPAVFECPFCHYEEDSENNLKKHIESNHPEVEEEAKEFQEVRVQKCRNGQGCRWLARGHCRYTHGPTGQGGAGGGVRQGVRAGPDQGHLQGGPGTCPGGAGPWSGGPGDPGARSWCPGWSAGPGPVLVRWELPQGGVPLHPHQAAAGWSGWWPPSGGPVGPPGWSGWSRPPGGPGGPPGVSTGKSVGPPGGPEGPPGGPGPAGQALLGQR